jgi:hypothetical protein
MINEIILGSYHLPLAAGHDPNQPDGAGLGRAACPPGRAGRRTASRTASGRLLG